LVGNARFGRQNAKSHDSYFNELLGACRGRTLPGAAALLKGGPAFWERVEGKLYRLADEPDLSPEKKQKIINALRKLSAKYKPYLDAAAGESLPGEPKK
jgi:hypothetical protein